MENKMGKRTLYPLLVAGTMVMGGLLGATSASAAPGCVVSAGVTQNANTVTGTGGNDTIDCTSADRAKTITGGGNDTITGTAFADKIDGGTGNDTLTGGNGDDTLTGGAGSDTLTGGPGADTLSGGTGDDTLTGAAADGGKDTLNGNAGTDTCSAVGTDPDSRTSCEKLG
jgi:Ca2+-binding RTX toxin-like protein